MTQLPLEYLAHALYADFLANIINICLRFNGSIISWIRTPAHNKAVGGMAASLHLTGLAADITFDSPEDQARAIRFAERRGLWFKPKTNAVHFQALPPATTPDQSGERSRSPAPLDQG